MIINPHKMTKQEFEELTGESPEDMFGSDWEAILEDYEFLTN